MGGGLLLAAIPDRGTHSRYDDTRAAFYNFEVTVTAVATAEHRSCSVEAGERRRVSA
jgi:hypothetical protein